MQRALQHERKFTAAIHDLCEVAVDENDRAAQVLLQWFIEAQVEEEKAVEEIVDHLRIVGGDGTGLIVIDARLGERTPEGFGRVKPDCSISDERGDLVTLKS